MLTAADFPAFIEEVFGRPPFTWQTDLVHQVLAEGRWPDVIDVPTGLGKTSMIDISLFVTACQSGVPEPSTLARRRIFFVVDRRIVVDEAKTHADLLARRINSAEKNSVTARVRSSLAALTGRSARTSVVSVTRMRGGATWAANWLDRPDQIAIVLGTVDQVGSRLFFRGYAVGDRRRPLDAAFTGIDSLILVDEAHLARPMIQSMEAAFARDSTSIDIPRATVIQLSATSAAPSGHVFALDADRHRHDAEAQRRLNARKSLVLAETTKSKFVGMVSDCTEHLLRSQDATSTAPHWKRVLIVCNTVDRARAVHSELEARRQRKSAPLDAPLLLLTGRTRAIEREAIVDEAVALFGVGRERSESAGPAILVATQTIEVGANLDADALITESAPWDSVVQRLGRLNRIGRFAEDRRDSAGRAIVVHDGEALGPVYGERRDRCWSTLQTLAGTAPCNLATDAASTHGMDVSPLACRTLTARMPGDALAEPAQAPILLTATLDAWTQTGPVPLVDPPLDAYLHGFDGSLAPVTVLWRDRLTDFDGSTVHAEHADALLRSVPPLAEEQLDVPLSAMRAWMSGRSSLAISDLDTGDLGIDPKGDDNEVEVLAMRARDLGGAAQSWTWVRWQQLRPGDVVVVPSSAGGVDEHGWNARSRSPVDDLSELAAVRRGRPRLYLDADLGERLGLDAAATATLATAIDDLKRADHDEESESLDHVKQALAAACRESIRPGATSPWTLLDLTHLADWLDADSPRLVHVSNSPDTAIGDPSRWAIATVLTGGKVPTETDSPVSSGAFMDDGDPAGTSVGGRVALSQHHRNVAARAEEICQVLGLNPLLTQTVTLAARWHDIGKVERRFQAMLHGGNHLAALGAEEPLAKSGMNPDDRRMWARARELSRLPRGARHEAWSASLLRARLRDSWPSTDIDVELLIHLVASHHGHARPWLPPVFDSEGTKESMEITADVDGVTIGVATADTVDVDQPQRFAVLNERYGRWGVALLESIVRCADMTVSSEGS